MLYVALISLLIFCKTFGTKECSGQVLFVFSQHILFNAWIAAWTPWDHPTKCPNFISQDPGLL